MALASVLKPQFISANQYNPCLLQEEYVGELSDLRQQASWLSHLVDTMPAGVIVLDGKGMIAKANQIAIDMLGEPLEGEKWFRRQFPCLCRVSSTGPCPPATRRVRAQLSQCVPHCAP